MSVIKGKTPSKPASAGFGYHGRYAAPTGVRYFPHTGATSPYHAGR
ncbi:MAG: hypothetical protein VB064_05320 [Oscillospiraceae bacterium]|nr:hypothetical protein [Oscillospiraceae bacterium]